MEKKCIECGTVFNKPYSLSRNGWKQQKLCSKKCRSVFLIKNHLKGSRNVRWGGGRGITTQGYIEVISVGMHSKNARGRILEHRLVMEKYLGRKLLSTEIVHHKNHNKQDNCIENLALLSSQSEHRKEHRPSQETRKKISEKMKGRIFSEEHRRNLSIVAYKR